MTTAYPVNDKNSQAIYGSNRAAQFIKDATSGTNSLDVIVFGDSNAGSDALTGYTQGWAQALTNLGIPVYATPMQITSHMDQAGDQNRSGGLFGDFVKTIFYGTSTAGASGTGTISNISTAVAAADTDAFAFDTYMGDISAFGIKPGSFTYDVAYISTGSNYTSPANGGAVWINAGHPMVIGGGAGGVELQYRVVYGTFPGAGGKFRLQALRGVNTQIAGSSSDISTDTPAGLGNHTYATATLNFNSPNSATQNSKVICSFDGYNRLGDWTPLGPVAFIWQSVIRRSYKGHCVSCLNYYGGATSTALANSVVAGGKSLESYIKEIRERQIAAGGTGRVIWWHNSGINMGGETPASWVSAAQQIVVKVKQVWASLGYPEADLAFVMAPSHPTNAGATGDNGWSQERTRVLAAAVNWIKGNNGFADSGVTLVDIGALISAAELSRRDLYQVFQNGKNESHLRSPPFGASSITYKEGSQNNVTSGTPGFYYSTDFDCIPQIPNNGYVVVADMIARALLDNL